MIRLATRADADVVTSIYNHYILNTVVSFEEAALSGADMALRIDKVRAFGLPWLVAENEEEVVGYAYATRWQERSAYKHTVEVSAYLSRTAVSQGWGTQLYKSLFEELRKSDIHVVIGGIALPNAASVALHEKFGMKKVAHFAEVGFKFGSWIDVGYWQVNLNA
jgi:L-amino acid N-acyltransferase YncA